MPMSRVFRFGFGAADAQYRSLAAGETEFAAVATGPLREAWGSWSRLATGSTAHDRYLVCDGAKDVEK